MVRPSLDALRVIFDIDLVLVVDIFCVERNEKAIYTIGFRLLELEGISTLKECSIWVHNGSPLWNHLVRSSRSGCCVEFSLDRDRVLAQKEEQTKKRWGIYDIHN